MNERLSLKAFSMIETVAGMVITAIVMGLIFVIFTIAGERLADYREQGRLVNDMNRLTYSINKDIFENSQMDCTDGLAFKGYAGNTVTYRFSPDCILRDTETFTDTFAVESARLSVDSARDKSGKLTFVKLQLQLQVNEKPLALHFYKPVFTSELINKKP